MEQACSTRVSFKFFAEVVCLSHISPQTRPETESPTQTEDSQFQFSQFMK